MQSLQSDETLLKHNLSIGVYSYLDTFQYDFFFLKNIYISNHGDISLIKEWKLVHIILTFVIHSVLYK